MLEYGWQIDALVGLQELTAGETRRTDDDIHDSGTRQHPPYPVILSPQAKDLGLRAPLQRPG